MLSGNMDVNRDSSEGHRIGTKVIPKRYDLRLMLTEGKVQWLGISRMVFLNEIEQSSILMHCAHNLDVLETRCYEVEGPDYPSKEKEEIKIECQSVGSNQISCNVVDRKLKKSRYYIIEHRFSGKELKNTESVRGMYHSKVDDIWLTQFEPTFARYGFPCIDEPSFKSVFRLELVVHDRYKSVLSNTELEHSESGQGEMGDLLRGEMERLRLKNMRYSVYRFKPTPVMSTYLLAWSIGNFNSLGAVVDENGQFLYTEDTKSKYLEKHGRQLSKPPLHHYPLPVDKVAFRPGFRINVFLPSALDVTKAMLSLTVAVWMMTFFRNLLQIEYPLMKCDFVGIYDFDPSAMENWGLITFQTHLLTHREELSDFLNVYAWESESIFHTVRVVAHEVAHQWFGNMVTMRWWNDLWLNEGFATWGAYRSIMKLFPKWRAKSLFLFYQNQLFRDDSCQRLQVINADVGKSCVQKNNNSKERPYMSLFNSVVYNKASCVITQLESLMGQTEFYRFLKFYLQKFQYKSIDLEMFGSTLKEYLTDQTEITMPVCLKEYIDRWITQKGFPIVSIEDKLERGISNSWSTTRTFRQRDPNTFGRVVADKTDMSSWVFHIDTSVMAPGEKMDTQRLIMKENHIKYVYRDNNYPMFHNNIQEGFYILHFRKNQSYAQLKNWHKRMSIEQIMIHQRDLFYCCTMGLNEVSEYIAIVKFLIRKYRYSNDRIAIVLLMDIKKNIDILSRKMRCSNLSRNRDRTISQREGIVFNKKDCLQLRKTGDMLVHLIRMSK